MQHGQDDRVIYDRKTLTFEEETSYSRKNGKSLPTNVKTLWDWFAEVRHQHKTSKYKWLLTSERITSSVFKGKNKASVEINQLNYVFFVGRVFKSVDLTVYQSTTSESQTLYSLDSIVKLLDHYGVVTENYSDVLGRIEKWFGVPVVVEQDWFIENKLSVAAFVVQKCNKNQLVINPNLKDYDFYRAVDPYTAFQELDMWISGTLAWPQNFMVEVSDKSKVAKHGFDPKYGFRARPREK